MNMRQFMVLLASALLVACHRPTEVRGMYVSDDSSATLFPCNDAKIAMAVPDSALTTRYHATTVAGKPLFVRVRGVVRHSGSIYSGRPYFQVQQILEVRPRAAGECPGVGEPITTFLPGR
jgi:hypothetical protein